MSGAEVLAAVGATSSVITICETCVTIVRFIQKCHPSETTARLKPQIELLAQTITQLKSLNLGSSVPDLSAVLNGCKKELQKLNGLLEKHQQASSTTLLQRARKSFKVPIWEERIREIWIGIQQYQSTISLYLDLYNTQRLLNAPYADLCLVSAHMRSKGYTPRQIFEELGRSSSLDQLDNSKRMTSPIILTLEGVRREDPRLIEFLLQMSFISVPAEFLFRDHFLVAQSRDEPLPTFYQLFIRDKQWSSENFFYAVMRLVSYALVREELIAGTSLSLQLMFQKTAIVASPLTTHDWEELSSHLRRVFRENILEGVRQSNAIISGPDNVRKYSGILEGYQTVFAAFLAMYSNEEKEARDLLQESLGLQSSWLGESASLTCATMTWLVLLYLKSLSLDEAEVMINRLNTAESQVSNNKEVPQVNVQFLKGHLQIRKQSIDHAVSIFKRCTDLCATITGIACVSTASALLSGVEAMLLQGNAEDATQALYDAERIEKEIDSPRALAIRIKWNLARHSLRMGDYVRAISCYKDLCEEHESNHDQAGSPFHRWEFFSLGAGRCIPTHG
ncbi:uncharacterized protein KD926_006304 [Aspergillus affinis]|uniref:uncharacterized protein n=1 Tax=Aspergillus affinis TaxID=1070780 RepID=UPI0022FE524F|nr:uncharacterized protein KD926_006304 [Aspergillus affinis]KAI9041967.1 hypothetical protein KD926_006304 [Aspergillus affinis]